MTATEPLVRMWSVYEALRSRPRGATAASLAELTGLARSTLYRYLHRLAEGGLPIRKERVNGEVRYRLEEAPLPAFALSDDERAALVVARRKLAPLEGTAVVDRIDRLLRRLRGHRRPPAWLSVRDEAVAHDRATVRAIDIALRDGRRLGFDYPDAAGAIRHRQVDPAALREVGAHVYLIAFDCDARDWRTFKVARIRGDIRFHGRAEPHPDFDERALFEHSVRIWAGEPVDVAVRLRADVAARASEWPLLPDQSVERRPDGSIVVRARVAGLVEVTRWVLSWGAAAEALDPPALRDAVAAELAAALDAYRSPPPRRAHRTGAPGRKTPR